MVKMKLITALLEVVMILVSVLVMSILIFNNAISAYLAVIQDSTYLVIFLLITVFSSLYTIFAVIKGKKLILKKMFEN